MWLCVHVCVGGRGSGCGFFLAVFGWKDFGWDEVSEFLKK